MFVFSELFNFSTKKNNLKSNAAVIFTIWLFKLTSATYVQGLTSHICERVSSVLQGATGTLCHRNGL
jgi:hypothetical protein